MAIDPDQARATTFEPITTPIERGRLAFFAKATGQTDPVWSDAQAAQAAGYADVPVPPTFFFSLELESPEAFGFLTGLGVDLGRVLHGEQAFTYRSVVHAGETVTLYPRIVDCFAKKGGALEFLVKETDVIREGVSVASSRTTLVVQNHGGAA